MACTPCFKTIIKQNTNSSTYNFKSRFINGLKGLNLKQGLIESCIEFDPNPNLPNEGKILEKIIPLLKNYNLLLQNLESLSDYSKNLSHVMSNYNFMPSLLSGTTIYEKDFEPAIHKKIKNNKKYISQFEGIFKTKTKYFYDLSFLDIYKNFPNISSSAIICTTRVNS